MNIYGCYCTDDLKGLYVYRVSWFSQSRSQNSKCCSVLMLMVTVAHWLQTRLVHALMFLSETTSMCTLKWLVNVVSSALSSTQSMQRWPSASTWHFYRILASTKRLSFKRKLWGHPYEGVDPGYPSKFRTWPRVYECCNNWRSGSQHIRSLVVSHSSMIYQCPLPE